MKLKLIIEEITKASRVAYHYTNIEGLERILDTGFLSGGFRSTPTRKGTKEISVVRPSSNMAKGSATISLSDSVDPRIKFVLYPEEIQSRVRGVRMKTIADYPSQDMEAAKRALFFRVTADATDNQKQKLVNVVFKAIANRKPEDRFASKKDVKAIQQAILQSDLPSSITDHFKDYKDVEGVLKRVWTKYGITTDNQKNREGEERITLPKGSVLPLDPKYMKLEIMVNQQLEDSFEENFIEEDEEEGKRRIKRFLNNIRKHKEIFDPKSYSKFVEMIERYLN